MRDFLNREIKPGHYICFSGAGNSKAEYGMQVALVMAVTETSIKVKRLNAYFLVPSVKTYFVHIKNTRQCSILDNFGSEKLWDLVVRGFSDGPLSDNEKIFLASWIHGKYPKWELID